MYAMFEHPPLVQQHTSNAKCPVDEEEEEEEAEEVVD